MSVRRVFLLASLPLALVASSRADDIVLTPTATTAAPGGKLSGQITAESPTSVQIKPTTGAAIEVPIDQIATITYTGQPGELTLAQSRETAGDLEGAAPLYQKAATQAAGKDLIQQAALFGEARALSQLAEADPSKIDEALTRLDALQKKYPASRHLASSLEWTAKLALNKADNARAEAALTELNRIPWAAELAAILMARVQSRKGEHDKALAAVDAIITRAPKGSESSYMARLVKAETLAAAARFADAETAAREVIQEAPPESAEIQAHAYNTLGACLKAANKNRDALFAYLHTDILYDQDKEQHALALAALAELWRAQGETGRASETLARLKDLYPNNPLATAEPAR